jgi:hypothetical protein
MPPRLSPLLLTRREMHSNDTYGIVAASEICFAAAASVALPWDQRSPETQKSLAPWESKKTFSAGPPPLPSPSIGLIARTDASSSLVGVYSVYSSTSLGVEPALPTWIHPMPSRSLGLRHPPGQQCFNASGQCICGVRRHT